MSASKQQPAIHAVSTVTVPSAVPLLVDIKAAAQMLGTSVFNVRNLMWHQQTRAMLSPVRLGAKYLFHPAKLIAFVDALVAGKIQFPATPTKAKRKVSR
jgi:hypothetical protein